MTSAPQDARSHYKVIYHCLEAVSRFQGTDTVALTGLQDLREVLPALPSPLALVSIAFNSLGPVEISRSNSGLRPRHRRSMKPQKENGRNVG